MTTLGKLRGLSVTELMTPVKSVKATDPLSRVIGFLKESKLYDAFVEKEEEQQGQAAVVSIRDLLNVSDVSERTSSITHHVPSLGPNNTIGDAATLMSEYRVRSLPIYEEGDLKGQITSPSIARDLLQDSDIGVKVSKMMTPKPICIDSSDPVSKARSMMIRKKVDQIPTVKYGRLKNVVTSDALVFNILPSSDRSLKGDTRAGRFDILAEDFALPEVPVNEPDDSLQEVFRNMSGSSANYSIIISSADQILGIVTYRDIMNLLSKAKTPDQIPMYIVGLPDNPFEAHAVREKFTRAIRLLARGSPDVTQARAIIKKGEEKPRRRKYQITVFIDSSSGHWSYRVTDYDLLNAFEHIDSWAKSLLSKGKRKRQGRVRSGRGNMLL